MAGTPPPQDSAAAGGAETTTALAPTATTAGPPAPARPAERRGSLDALVQAESRRRRRRRIAVWAVGVVLVLAVVAAIAGYVTRGKPKLEELYRTEPISKGDVLRVVTATGKLEARSTVEVGTKISGRVAKVVPSWNDHVTEGDVIVELDKTALQAQLAQANANLALARAAVKRAKVNLDDARVRLDRVEKLFARGVETEVNRDAVRLAVRLAEADVTSAEAQVDLSTAAASLAAANLADATIRSPITGVVISRSVEVGQTVAAAFSTPVLFVLAEDLTKMRVVASVDEADIGAVARDQKGTFTVDAFPGEMFHAAVTEIRSAPVVVSSVVTYETLLEVDNPKGELRPGMTASVRLETASAHDVLRAPNAGLRFTPPGEHVGEGGPRFWTFGGAGLEARTVTTGISDGHLTEVKGDGVSDGLPVIVDVTELGRKVLGLEKPR
jgi:HlyD family secretion protein